MGLFGKPSSKLWLALFSAVLLTVCSANALMAETPKAGGEIKVRVRTDLTSTDPLASTALINASILGHVVEPLLAYNEDLKIVPVAAESWKISEDYKAYTFFLIKGKKFHNGREMTAEDVKFSVARMMDPNACKRAKLFAGVDRVEVVDKYTVIIHLKEPNAGFTHALAYIAPVMAIMPKEEIEKQGREIIHPVGTGPYKFVEWKPDRHVILEKFKFGSMVNLSIGFKSRENE